MQSIDSCVCALCPIEPFFLECYYCSIISNQAAVCCLWYIMSRRLPRFLSPLGSYLLTEIDGVLKMNYSAIVVSGRRARWRYRGIRAKEKDLSFMKSRMQHLLTVLGLVALLAIVTSCGGEIGADTTSVATPQVGARVETAGGAYTN